MNSHSSDKRTRKENDIYSNTPMFNSDDYLPSISEESRYKRFVKFWWSIKNWQRVTFVFLGMFIGFWVAYATGTVIGSIWA